MRRPKNRRMPVGRRSAFGAEGALGGVGWLVEDEGAVWWWVVVVVSFRVFLSLSDMQEWGEWGERYKAGFSQSGASVYMVFGCSLFCVRVIFACLGGFGPDFMLVSTRVARAWLVVLDGGDKGGSGFADPMAI